MYNVKVFLIVHSNAHVLTHANIRISVVSAIVVLPGRLDRLRVPRLIDYNPLAVRPRLWYRARLPPRPLLPPRLHSQCAASICC